MTDSMVPVGRLRPIVQEYLDTGGTRDVAGVNVRSFYKVLEEDAAVTFDFAERLLIAIGREDEWHHSLADLYAPVPVGLRCEDCGKQIADVDDHRPLDLMRPDPSSSRWVWDATKQRPTYRPRNARPGGRRFRKVDLCRRCAGEALRQRAARHGTVMENSRKRALLTRERVAPKRGGRPRLLTDPQLRDLHALYEREGLSMGDLASQLVAGGRIRGTRAGLYQSMLYGWRRLGLPLRPKSEAQALAHHRRGRKPAAKRHCPATTGKGTSCRLGPKIGLVYCVSHQHLEQSDRQVAA